MGNIAAFYDIDGTLFREALSIELFKRLIKSGIIPHYKWHNIVKPIYDKWASREGNYDDYIIKMFEVYTESIVGINSGIISFMANQVVEEKGNRLYRYTKSKLLWHQKQGHKVIIISGSSNELVSSLAKKLNATDSIGTIYEINDNKEYTGKVKPMWDRKNKEVALNDFVKKYDIDLSASYAYGDTNGDFAMLNLVGFPTVINPTNELIETIKAEKDLAKRITTVVERKDVIYKLDVNNIECIDIK